MSIDNFTDEGIKIQELTILEPAGEKKLHFDPMLDISKSKKESLKDILLERYETVEVSLFAEQAFHMWLLFSDMRDDIKQLPDISRKLSAYCNVITPDTFITINSFIYCLLLSFSWQAA